MAFELYQQLEISPQATLSEIKKSYYRLVRKYSPEKEPEKFKSIRAAYETLSDPKAKESYDSLQKHGEEVSKLVDEAAHHMEDENWSSAIPLLKKVVVILPKESAALNQLGICFGRLEDWINALKVYRRLTKNEPEIPLYWINYGNILQTYADSLEDDDSRTSDTYNLAREQFKKAIDLEPYNSEPYLNIAYTYTDEGFYDKALIWTERAISADGKTDLQDFEALFYICVIYLRSNEFQKIQSVADRIIDLLSDADADEDAHKYVAARFYDYGVNLAKLGFDNSNIILIEAGSYFFKAAKIFDPDNPDIKNLKGILDNLLQAYEMYDSVTNDIYLSTGFSRLAAYSLSDALNHEIENKEEVLKDIVTEIFNGGSNSQIIQSVDRMKLKYFSLYKLEEALYERIREFADQNKNTKKSGCFFTTTCVQYAGLPDDCFELQTLRYFRDNYLISIPEGQSLITEYYENAPLIVFWINLDKNYKLILEYMLQIIRVCVLLIINENPKDALNCYKDMYDLLKERYL